MKNKRAAHGDIIKMFQKKVAEIEKETEEGFLENVSYIRYWVGNLISNIYISLSSGAQENALPESNDADILTAFEQVITSKKRENTDSLYKKDRKKGGGATGAKRKRTHKPKDENYVPYTSADKHTEEGLAINSFEQQAKIAEFSISNRIEEQSTFRPGQKKWDRLKKKMVPVVDPRAGKIRTESGIWIPNTFKTNRYADWKEKTKIEDQVHRDLEESGE